MKAVVYEKYGSPEVLQLMNIDKPKPKDNEILVRIHAATVTSGDVRLRSSDFPPLVWLVARLIFGLFKPKKTILGHELAGVVEETGKNVNRFKVGDEVFGTSTMLKTGSYAEFICLPQEWKSGVVEKKPKNLNFNQAAAMPVGSMTAMYLLDHANLTSGQKVLIYGASGSVGSFAVQLAKIQGSSVTAVCSGSNFDMVKSLGAENLIDYKKEDFTEGKVQYDIIFDAVGKISKSKVKKVLSANGSFVTVKMLTKEKGNLMNRIIELAEKGEFKPFIDRYFSLEEVAKAHEYVDRGHKRGNVVIEIIKQ